MKIVKALFCLLAITLFGATVLSSARADTWDKKTVVTFSQAVEVPGKVLPAGTYTFQLLDSPSDRHIVQIFNADGTHIIATILAINNYRLEPTGDTVMKFSERPGDSPDALRAWFYPGDNFGQEFVYPKVRAIQLAQTTKVIVPAVAVDTLDDNTIKTVPIVAVTPDEKEVEVATVIQTTPPATPAAAETEELPQTGSVMPLLALLGAAFIGLAVGLKLVLKLAS
jgi:LPXTG-motif cell wall-anchored protein